MLPILLLSSNNAYSIPDSAKAIILGSTNMGLEQWKAMSGKDVSSVMTTSSFVNAGSDLHIDKNKGGAVDLARKAMPLTNILFDIDDSTRSLTAPCIGADEFKLNNIDGGALAVIAPAFPTPLGNNAVVASIRNYGDNTINSATVNWSVNGVDQTPYAYSGSIGTGETATNLTLGNYNFPTIGKYDIKVWTSNVNGGSDANALNDTITKTVYPALCGVITVAGTSPDFPTLKAALAYANLAGITCATTLNIRDGEYNENDTIQAIFGLSAANTLTIQSESLDSSKVSLFQADYANNASSSTVLLINNAKYINLKHLTIKRTAPGGFHFYFNVIGVSGNCTGLNITNCELATTGAGFIVNYALFNTVASDINISNNNFIGGSNTLTVSGAFNNPIRNVVINNNKFRIPIPVQNSQANAQLTSNNVTNLAIENNLFESTVSGTGNSSGMYLGNIKGKTSIVSNRINKRRNSYGIYMNNVTGGDYADSAVIVANNFASLDSTGNFYGALYMENIGRNVKVAYNNLLNNSTSTNSYAMYFSHNFNSGSYRDTIVNNNIITTGAGYALYQRQISNADVNATNNNIWSSAGTNLANYNNTTYNTVAALATASGTYSQSASINPLYINSNDLHVSELALRTLGKPVSYITSDIDNDVRGTTNSTIGADEIVINNNDAGITALAGPVVPFAAGTQNVLVTVKNYGNSTLATVTVNWSINGVMQTPYNYSGSIPFNTLADVAIGTANFVIDSAYNIKAWTTAPNGSSDAAAINDTVLVNNIYPALNGTYTIGGVSPDFKTFNRSSTNLKYGGMLGNVIFNARDGRYNETLLVDSIPFQENFNVTYQSESNDSSKVMLAWTPTLNDNVNAIIQLNNTKNITIRKMTVQVKIPASNPSASYKSIVWFSKKTKNILFSENKFVDSTNINFSNTTGSAFFYNTDAATSTQTLVSRSKDSSITIDRNLFRQENLSTSAVIDLGGSYQGNFNGNQTVLNYLNNVTISNNRFDMKILSKPAINVTFSDIVNLTKNKLQGTVYLSGKDLMIMDKNQVYHEGYNQNVVTIASNSNRTADKPVIVSNNMIQSVRSGFFNGVPVPNNALLITGDRANIIHNTIVTTDTGNIQGWATGAALAITNSTFDTIKNNIIYNVNGGHLLNTNSRSNLVFNNNNYVYTNHFSANANTLGQHQSLTGQDAQSVEKINPYFRGPKDLHASNINLKNAPEVVPGLPLYNNDVDGDVRGATRAYGADEFVQPANDMIVLSATPDRIFPAGTNDVKIRVYNNGTNPITSFFATAGLINYQVSYIPTSAGSLAYNYSW